MINIYNKLTKSFGEVQSFEFLPPEEQENSIIISNELMSECMKLKSQGYEIELDDNLEIHKTLNQDKVNRINEAKIDRLRNKRKPLLEAFDKYKTNVNYGIIVEDEETKGRIISWYSDLLNLVESAFKEDNIPSEIKYYLR